MKGLCFGRFQEDHREVTTLESMLLSGLSLGLLFAPAGLAAQNPFQSGTKYRTHFVIYDVQKKTATTIVTIEGEWQVPYRSRRLACETAAGQRRSDHCYSDPGEKASATGQKDHREPLQDRERHCGVGSSTNTLK
jgi:hypothetical protein